MNKIYKIVIIAMLLIFVLSMALIASAATEGSHPITAKIPKKLKITVASTLVTFDALDFDGVPVEYSGSTSVGVKVLCNSKDTWYLKVKADDDLKTADAEPFVIPASQLSVNPGTGTYTSLTTSYTTLDSGNKTSGWQNYNMQYKLSLDGTEYAGDYTTSITYTLTTIP